MGNIIEMVKIKLGIVVLKVRRGHLQLKKKLRDHKFKVFKYQVSVKYIATKEDEERILWLGNLLLNELLKQGREITGSDNIVYIQIWAENPKDTIRVANGIKGWEVKGVRDELVK